MRLPRRFGALVHALVLSLAVALPAIAAEPPRLDGPVTDEVRALDDGRERVEAALDELLRDHDLQLFVLFVATTDGQPAQDASDAVAAANSLGGNDALLLVALEDRTYAVWLAEPLERDIGGQIDRINVETLEPGLRSGDYPAAVIATAEALGDAVTGAGATPTPGAGGGSGGSGDGGLGGVLGLLLVVGGVGLVGWWIVRRRQVAADAEERDRRTGQLAREANALLIATDERVRDAGQELGFVEAEYGEEETGPLRAAIGDARAELAAAFAVRQRLDDAEPETPDQRIAMLEEIVERSRRAQGALDREAERIQRLRDLERDAPQILAALPDRIAAAEARIPAAEAALAELATWAAEAGRSVRGNVEEARKGLAGARAAVARGSAALQAGNRRAAGREARTAESGLAGAGSLIEAIEKLAATARQAADAIPAELDAAAADLAEARRALAGGPAASRTEQAVDAAEAALRGARSAAAGTPLDPIDALRQATAAHRAADEVLAAARQDAEQRARFVGALDASITTARADIGRAEDYVATRRGGIGRRARTRLAEAQRELDRAVALRDSDPRRAMDAATRAERLADEAMAEAGTDFDSWNNGGPTWGGGGGNQAGAILGGILTGILLGGRGGGGGGWGGSPWGSSGPTIGLPGGWGGGGRSRGGGWGGGGGGGGRSRGGRW